jgi:cyclic beta-1,2-glucan synthetase
MKFGLLLSLLPKTRSAVWNDTAPIREELFGVERLEQHAESLAAAQPVTPFPAAVLPLSARLKDSAGVLLAAYRATAAQLEQGGGVVPAAEWLLDNYHLVEAQIREIRDDLPPGYYRQLPKLAEGPLAGYPRVFGLAWGYVAHTDSHFDPATLRRFVAAYQRVQPLTIGELWAVAITLRIVLVENLRRLTDQITLGRATRAAADELADRLVDADENSSASLERVLAALAERPLEELFAGQLVKRLRDQDPSTTPALGWLEKQLAEQGASIEDLVQRVQQRQGASNVTVRNVITSMRLISDVDWADFFESVSLVDASLRAGSAFASMDFSTRNMYRSAIEQLARRSGHSEQDVTEKALSASRAATPEPSSALVARHSDPGYRLIGGGRMAFEREIGFRPPLRHRLRRCASRLGIGGYIIAMVAVALLTLTPALWAVSPFGIGGWWLALLGASLFMPALDVATALVNRAVTSTFDATTLPGLELAEGIPATLRTLIAVPTMLTDESDILRQVENLEVHYLASVGGDLTFALLLDGLDADAEALESDAEMLATADEAIAQLNLRHGPGPAGDRFLLLHRRRIFNAGENKWMGWERKRGKLQELNWLLRGATNTSFVTADGVAPAVPEHVRFVITLDADTRLPRDAVRLLVGKMAHPLNRPSFDAAQQRVVDGYAILQPRVTPSLPMGREGSIYQRVFSAPGGMDPYAAAISDVYQDLFGEGSYTGKGIYDVDAFEAALKGRVPENALLSHDLFEGIFARAGLASDVEFFEEFPARYDVAVKRQHRWTRGDWQLLPWIFDAVAGRSVIPPVGLGKMVDNLRRSMQAPFTLMALVVSWMMPAPVAIAGTLLTLAAIAVPNFLPVVFAIVPRRAGIGAISHLNALGADLRLACWQAALTVTFLPDNAWRMGDAAARTLGRLLITHRNLLEWTTAAQAKTSPHPNLSGFYREMAGGTVLGLAVPLLVLLVAPLSWPFVAPFALLWLTAPAIALWISRAQSAARKTPLSRVEATDLRLIARRTWRYFETFVTPDDNMLPPDNFQETPKPVVAHRTSPTNMGLYLLSVVAARDFGWIGTLETAERLEATLASMQKLPRHNGHFFNWYETRDVRPLDPIYVSSVDSGNLAGHLIALSSACREWSVSPEKDILFRQGFADNLFLAREALQAWSFVGEDRARVAGLLQEIDATLQAAESIETLLPALRRLTERAVRAAEFPGLHDGTAGTIDLIFWVGSLRKLVGEYSRDRLEQAESPNVLRDRFREISKAAHDMAISMDFDFLLDKERKLLSIGYSLIDNRLDPNCYDLLASEARLASLFAISKGDVATRHWFRLGRTATPLGGGSALISWSGSMFEYLMPSLVMRAPTGSLLEQTNQLVVRRQQDYGRSLGIPWGISESAYNARDLEFTYQYSNFGVPGLGLKRGLAENAVIAPYATGLAAMIDPAGAVKNYARLAGLGAQGRYGFYEALDYTKSRLPEGAEVAIVRNFMAHHQGMTIVAIANALQDGRMRARFHDEPMIQASELLLQERMPRDVAVARPRAEEVKVAAAEARLDKPVARRASSPTGAPITHLLSNGRYTVMLTSAGSGYSRWRDIAVTRWREDTTRDNWGSYIFLRQPRTGKTWSAGSQPLGADAEDYQAVFGEDHAQFIRRDGNITTTMEVLVSGEDDCEVRRVSLASSSGRTTEIELTSYAELVLSTPAADNAHPAFSKMFVQTEYLAEYGAIIATRRRRSPSEPEVWAAHFGVVEGAVGAVPEYETDRANFIGRSRDVSQAAAVTGLKRLSNTTGTVLDPIFALRFRLAVSAGKVARIAFWTVVAASRAELLDLIDKHLDRNAFERAKTLAWTQAQVQLRHLDVDAVEAADFQRLAAPIIYSDPRFRPSSEAIVRGAGAQSGVWPHGISGDLPIVLCLIDDIEDIDQVRQLLRAHEYWRMKQLAVDLVIINDRGSSYVQDLQIAIETAVRMSQSRPRLGQELAQGSVHTLRADLMTPDSRALLQSAARVVLLALRGPIAEQLERMLPLQPKSYRLSRTTRWASFSTPEQPLPELEFFNGLGGFDKDGREYVTILRGDQPTPAPWINVIANPGFGFHVAAEGSGYTWSDNSRENQLTPWSNDPVADPSGEAIFVRDEDSGELWSPTAQPIRDNGTYIARHGRGFSRFEHTAQAIALELVQFVPLADPIKISRLRLRNLSGQLRRISVTGYVEWVLGTSRGASAPTVVTQLDAETGAILARNPWNLAFGLGTAFADLAGQQTAWTADRTEFLGRNGTLSAPAALTNRTPLSGRIGAGLDPCAALQTVFEIKPGETVEIVFTIGQTASVEEARSLINRYRDADLGAILGEVERFWDDLLGTVQVKTPDRAMDIMLNGWLLYQTLACRVWARSAFYQASGAYGFRDQLQDGMALTFARPAMTREHLVRAAGRQFVEGDVQHWWLPHSGQGVRTGISDDRVWLAYGVATYIGTSGDTAILDESISFLAGPMLKPGEHDAFFQPTPSDASASMFEHCARGLDQAIAASSERGLPLIGTGDWNDGMNRVGEGGKGESVWLGWLLLKTIELFAPFAETREAKRAIHWRNHARLLGKAMEAHTWDGAWYRRGSFDDGTLLGSSQSDECKIDSIAQSWAVLSGAADPDRASQAMASLDRLLIRREDGLALLFTPPFDKTLLDPGYIKGYPPGLRENGGQYSHAAMWAVLAFARLGQGDKASSLFSLLNPINHARTPEGAARYRVEPYVVAADVYSVDPHVGRGGWTWYTGSAGWMYRAGIEGILGIRFEGASLVIDPCIPATWPGFDATVQRGSTTYEISVSNPNGSCRGVDHAELDGLRLELDAGPVRVPMDGRVHRLSVVLGGHMG